MCAESHQRARSASLPATGPREPETATRLLMHALMAPWVLRLVTGWFMWEVPPVVSAPSPMARRQRLRTLLAAPQCWYLTAPAAQGTSRHLTTTSCTPQTSAPRFYPRWLARELRAPSTAPASRQSLTTPRASFGSPARSMSWSRAATASAPLTLLLQTLPLLLGAATGMRTGWVRRHSLRTPAGQPLTRRAPPSTFPSLGGIESAQSSLRQGR